MPETQKAYTYIKSPLNYVGGKYKLLPQILPHFPNDISVFVDLFSGGSNIGINVSADKIICNDINFKVIEMLKAFQKMSANETLSEIEERIEMFHLSKENEEGFLKFREHYNTNPNPIDLYVLICYSFNNQIRFNNNHQYNSSFGKDRSCFSKNMRANLIAFINETKAKNIEFINGDFIDFNINKLCHRDFVYCDPPYLITTAAYNDGNRGFKNWGNEEEKQLYLLLDELHRKNIKFALSNILTHKGRQNDILAEWSKNYTVIKIESDYSNSNYHTKRDSGEEVLIVNY